MKRWGKTSCVSLLVVLLDILVVTQIMGVSYGPFSWDNMALETVYPVITNVWIEPLAVHVSASVGAGGEYMLQKKTNLVGPGPWVDVPPVVTAGSPSATFDDKDVPLPDAQFYRLQQVGP